VCLLSCRSRLPDGTLGAPRCPVPSGRRDLLLRLRHAECARCVTKCLLYLAMASLSIRDFAGSSHAPVGATPSPRALAEELYATGDSTADFLVRIPNSAQVAIARYDTQVIVPKGVVACHALGKSFDFGVGCHAAGGRYNADTLWAVTSRVGNGVPGSRPAARKPEKTRKNSSLDPLLAVDRFLRDC
jgi:hypothetical protein